MLEFLDIPAQWATTVNILFLAATGFIAVHGLRARNPDGNADFVHLLFGCIAAVFFFLVLFQDVLGIVKF